MSDPSAPGKTAAVVAYITIVGCLIAITMNIEEKNEYARFHIRQAFGIHVLFHALAILMTYAGYAYLAIPVYLFYFYANNLLEIRIHIYAKYKAILHSLHTYEYNNYDNHLQATYIRF